MEWITKGLEWVVGTGLLCSIAITMGEYVATRFIAARRRVQEVLAGKGDEAETEETTP